MVIIDQSIIDRNSNFLSTVINKARTPNFILINERNVKVEHNTKYKPEVKKLKKSFSPELLVRTIELY